MRKVQIRTILGSFYAKSEDGTNSHFVHNMSYQMCSVQYTDSQVGSDGDLGEGEEEEGGGAGLGMGDVLGVWSLSMSQ